MDFTAYLARHEPDPDDRIKGIWEELLLIELTHSQLWGDMLRKCAGRDPKSCSAAS